MELKLNEELDTLLFKDNYQLETLDQELLEYIENL